MRQFLLAGAAAYSAAANVQSVATGAVAFFYLNNGVATATATGEEIVAEGNLVLGRTSALGGPVILPIHKHHFSFAKSEYEAATKFVGTITIPAPTSKGTYSLIISKNGLKFNQRSNYTAEHYVPADTGTTDVQLATALTTRINNNTASSGIIATRAGAVITLTAVEFGKDYSLTPADKLTGVAVTYTTRGIPALNDAAYIRDLANKAAADKGYSYTYTDDVALLYPGYDTNPLAQPAGADVGYTVFSLRFAEPRKVKTRDEVVHQIVQVAFPTGAAGIATFETVCETLSGIPYEV